jgi:hypothetical protein
MKFSNDDPRFSITVAAEYARHLGGARGPGEALVTLQSALVQHLLGSLGMAVDRSQAVGCAGYLSQLAISTLDADVGPTPDRNLVDEELAAMTICLGLNVLALVDRGPDPWAGGVVLQVRGG